jgi:hypothetical protein
MRVVEGSRLEIADGTKWSSLQTVGQTSSTNVVGGELRTEPGRSSLLSGGGAWLGNGRVIRAAPFTQPGEEGTWFRGGAVSLTDGASMIGSARLDWIVLNGEWDLIENSVPGYIHDSLVYVRNGLTLNGTLSLGSADGTVPAQLDFIGGNQRLDGNGTVRFGAASVNALGQVSPSSVMGGDFADHSQPLRLVIRPGITIAGGNYTVGFLFVPGVSVSPPFDFINYGTIRVDGPTNVATVSLLTTWTNAGVLLASDGATLRLQTRAPGALQNDGAIVAQQRGKISATLAEGLRLAGTVNLEASSRMDLTGRFTQTANGELIIGLGGTQPGVSHGLLAVNGAAGLGGTLRLELATGFAPQTGNTFGVLTWTTRTGTVGTLPGTNVGGGWVLSPNYAPTGLTLTAGAP